MYLEKLYSGSYLLTVRQNNKRSHSLFVDQVRACAVAEPNAN